MMIFNRLWDLYFIKNFKLRPKVTKIIYGDSDKIIKLSGLDFSINSVRENGYLRASLLSKKSQFLSHELYVLSNLCALASHVDGFIDIGANIGTVSAIVKNSQGYRKENFKCIAFEPHPDTFLRLSQNASRYGFSALNFGVGEGRKIAGFVDGGVSHVFSRREYAYDPHDFSKNFDVEIVPLDEVVEVVEGNETYAVKIDVEGAEAEVVLGMKRLIETDRIKAIVFDGLRDLSTLGYLRQQGFKIYDFCQYEDISDSSFSICATKLDV